MKMLRWQVLFGVGMLSVGWMTAAHAQQAEDSTSQPVTAEAPQSDGADETTEAKSGADPTDLFEDARSDESPGQMSAEDILREFQKERPKAKPVLPSQPESNVNGLPRGTDRMDEGGPSRASTGAGRGLRMPEGYFLVDRVGRVVRDDNWWVLHLVGDNNPNASPDPPLRLLPNRLLERMVREVESSNEDLEFVVSGEITEFMGENYLLLRKLLRRRNVGNLSR